jgi:hypothetical protein
VLRGDWRRYLQISPHKDGMPLAPELIYSIPERDADWEFPRDT